MPVLMKGRADFKHDLREWGRGGRPVEGYARRPVGRHARHRVVYQDDLQKARRIHVQRARLEHRFANQGRARRRRSSLAASAQSKSGQGSGLDVSRG